MRRTFFGHPTHINVNIDDVRNFGLTNLIRPIRASMSTRAVQLELEEFGRLRPMMEAQGVEITVKISRTDGRNTRRRMPYNPELVLRPIRHGDFMLTRSGHVGMVMKTAKGLVLKGRNMHLIDFTRWAEKRIEQNDVDEITRTQLEEWYLDKRENPVVKVEVGIYTDEEPDLNLAAYLSDRRPEVRQEINIYGRPLSVFSFRLTPRAAAILETRCLGSRRIRPAGNHLQSYDGVYSYSYDMP